MAPRIPTRIPSRPRDRGYDRDSANRMVGEFLKYPVTLMPQLMNDGAYEYRVLFIFNSQQTNITVQIIVLLWDWQTDADLTITDIGTSPHTERSKGFGSRAIEYLKEWAVSNKLNKILATQVSSERSEKFWGKNGFVRCPEPNPTSDFVLQLPDHL
jgi:hypothetical protein